MSTDGHLNSFYFLPIMNNVGTIIMYKFLYEHTFSIHLGIYLKVVLLDYTVFQSDCIIVSSLLLYYYFFFFEISIIYERLYCVEVKT